MPSVTSALIAAMAEIQGAAGTRSVAFRNAGWTITCSSELAVLEVFAMVHVMCWASNRKTHLSSRQTRGGGGGGGCGGGNSGEIYLDSPNNETYHHLRSNSTIVRLDQILGRDPNLSELEKSLLSPRHHALGSERLP
jgi:hypothetical protein